MGRGQAVRHQVLVLAFVGSNPTVPAKLYNRGKDRVPRPLLRPDLLLLGETPKILVTVIPHKACTLNLLTGFHDRQIH